MRRLLVFFASLMLIAWNAWGETLFISDSVRMPLRSGPGMDYRIIDMVNAGQKVESLEKREDWNRVQVLDGKEGWMSTRHLTTDPPSILLVEALRRENTSQKEKLADLSSTNTRLSGEVKQFTKELEETRAELAALKSEHEALKTGSSNYLDLKGKYEKSAAALKEITQRAENYDKDLTRLQLHQNIWWFLSGAGVLVVGFLIGFSSKRQRKRPSFL